MVADHSPEQDFQASMAFYLSSRLSASASHTFHNRSRKSTKWTCANREKNEQGQLSDQLSQKYLKLQFAHLEGMDLQTFHSECVPTAWS
jgi:hypothetical protein